MFFFFTKVSRIPLFRLTIFVYLFIQDHKVVSVLLFLVVFQNFNAVLSFSEILWNVKSALKKLKAFSTEKYDRWAYSQ